MMLKSLLCMWMQKEQQAVIVSLNNFQCLFLALNSFHVRNLYLCSERFCGQNKLLSTYMYVLVYFNLLIKWDGSFRWYLLKGVIESCLFIHSGPKMVFSMVKTRLSNICMLLKLTDYSIMNFWCAGLIANLCCTPLCEKKRSQIWMREEHVNESG